MGLFLKPFQVSINEFKYLTLFLVANYNSLPTYVQLPNGQLQMVQPIQQPTVQTIYVAPPPPRPVVPVQTSEDFLYRFLIAQILRKKKKYERILYF